MSSTTAAAIIRSALGKLGIVAPGESVKPNDAEDCLRALNVLLDGWLVENLYAYATQTIDHALGSNALDLTIGPTGDIVVAARPVRFEAGCYYSTGGVDYPLQQINEAEFNAIGVKPLPSLGPCVFTYNPTLPNGALRFYPQASGGATLHLVVQVQLAAFADLSTEYTIAPGYERALVYTLAEEVGADFEREIPPTVARNAANARRFLKRANLVVPQLIIAAPVESPLAQIIAG